MNDTKLNRVRIFAFLFVVFHFFGCGQTSYSNKVLKVKEILYSGEINLTKVSELLEENVELHSIDLINWQKFQYQPEVQLRIAHNNNEIWLKYYVNEKSILAEVTKTNGGVANDSCVEFFFDPKADGNYYNFEFSCIGTTHLAYGPAREDRQYVPAEIIEKEIGIASSLGNRSFSEKTGDHTWEMTIIIPTSILIRDKGIQLKGLTTKANFYKCGNKTAEAHYLSWNPVQTQKPDFHRPEFFGSLIFE